MNCVNCGAPMRIVVDKMYFSCEYCGAVHYPAETPDGVRSLGQPSYIKCSLCKEPLSYAAIEDIPVRYCEKCRGILIPVSLFVPAIQKRRRKLNHRPLPHPSLNQRELERRIACPQCGRTMDTHPYSGPGNIVIDNCPVCRVNWLDYQEFWRIVTSPERTYQDDDPFAWIRPDEEHPKDDL